jgi:CRP/FNR family cyclic AMP-dependent transcriptional regulator
VDEEGRELILAYLGQGDFIGEIGLFHPVEAREVSIRTRNRCELAAIAYSRFRVLLEGELAADQGPLLHAMAAQLAQRVLQSSRKLSLMAYNDVHSRVEAALYELSRGPTAEAHPLGVKCRISRTEISRVVGCSREVVGKVLKSLEQQGLIGVSGQNVVVYRGPGKQG